MHKMCLTMKNTEASSRRRCALKLVHAQDVPNDEEHQSEFTQKMCTVIS